MMNVIVVSVEDGQAEHHPRTALLRAAGYRVIEAASNEEACRLASKESSMMLLLREESDERFRIMADSAPALIWMNGLDGCEFVNQKYLRFLGVKDVEVRGYDWAQFIHPDDRKGYVTAYLEAVVERRLFEATFRFRRHDGEYRWMKSVGTPRFGADGAYMGYVGSTLDFNEIKAPDQEPKKADTVQTIQVLTADDSPSVFLRYGVAALCAASAVLMRWLLDPYLGSYLPLATIFGFVGIAAWYAGWGPALFTVTVSYLAANWLFIEPKYELSFPVKELWGLSMYLFSTLVLIGVGEAMRHAQRQARLNAAIAVESRQKVEAEMSVRKHAEETLRESELKFRTLTEVSPQVVWMTDTAGHITYLNPYWVTYTGLALEQMQQLPPGTPLHADDHESVMAAWARSLQTGEPFSVEQRLQSRDGSYRWFLGRGTPVRNERGEIERWIGIYVDIDERKRVEENLRESEERFRTLAEAVPSFLFETDAAGWNTWTSDAWCRFTGQTLEQVTGHGWAEALHPEDRAANIERWTACMRDGLVFESKQQLRRTDGSYAWVIARALPVHDRQGTIVRWVGSVTDVDAIVRAEERLRESEERYRSLNTVITDVPWVTDASGAFINSQSAWEAYTGQSWEEHRGYGWTNVLHPEDRERVQAIWLRACNTRTLYESHGRLWHAPTQQWRYYVARATSLLNADGSVREWVGSCTDVHDQTMAEQALREAQDHLQRWNVELEQAVNVKTAELQQSQERLRALATELNLAEQRERSRLATQLHDHLQQTLVLGKIKLGQGKRLAESVPACAKVITETDEVLSEALLYTRSLVNDLSPPVLRDHGLPAGLKWLGDYMKKHDVAVTVHVPEREDLNLPDDQAVLLFQSVRELLINSVKHAGTGYATVTLAQQDGHLEIEVSDEGAGFDLAAAAAAAAETPNGGLSSKFGLFSIRERMKALGGRFEIESAPGKGTTATLTLPLGGRSGLSSLSGRSSPSGDQGSGRSRLSGDRTDQTDLIPHSPLSSTRVRVLLVDDHAMVRQGLRTVLESYADIEVIGEASNGEEALALAAQSHPTLVVMDINMPKMNGIEATEKIKARYPYIVVIGLSVNVGSDSSDAMRKAGAATLLTKEAAVDELYKTIQQALKREERLFC
jgi:PAS domain S-box-containing protein